MTLMKSYENKDNKFELDKRMLKRVFINKGFPGIFFLSFSVGIFLVIFQPSIKTTFLFSDSFILNFLITFLALSVAMFTLLFSTVDKLRDTILKLEVFSEEDTRKVEEKVFNTLDELEEDTFLIFYSLLIIIISILVRKIDISFLQWPNIFPFSKQEFFVALKFGIIVINLFALNDIIHSLFTLMKATGEVFKSSQ